VNPPDPAEQARLDALRAALPSLRAAIQLNTGTSGPLPTPVAEAMAELEAFERDLGRAQQEYYDEFVVRLDEARAAVAAVLGGDLDEIAVTHATTDGLNLGAWSIDWQPGDRLVSSTGEHSGGVGPLYGLRDLRGVELEFVEAGEGDPAVTDDDIVAGFERALDRGARMVMLSHVLWTNGRVMPVRRIADAAHARGALVLVDGAQAAGAMPVAVRDTGADLYSIPAQKWLLGPEGMGALWVAREVIGRLRPPFGGHFAFEAWDSRGGLTLHRDARRFQASPYHRPAVVGMARALGWLTMTVGLPWVHERGARLARATVERLAAIEGVTVLTPRERMATLVTLRIPDWDPDVARDILGQRFGIVCRTIGSLRALRVSVGAWTTETEIERLVEAITMLATHAPGTLPPRPTLPLFGEA
jgi:L-cysteine/cystine lyase